LGVGKVAFSDQKYKESRERLQPFKLEMIELISFNHESRVLDIGCGTGIVSRILKERGLNVVGSDISGEGMKKYCQSGLIGLVSNVEYGLPFKSHVFDGVWISEVIEHIVEYQSLIEEIWRVLKPKGRLYLTTPNSIFYGYRLMYLLGKCPSELQHPYHLRFFSPKYLCRILLANGFEIEKRLGQNIYVMIPKLLINMATRLSATFGKMIIKLITSLGFKEVEGLVHGDKYLYYKFSAFCASFFGNVIMIVARKSNRRAVMRVTL